jgi:hypothetical protein
MAQPSPEQLREQQRIMNRDFMQLSYSQPISAQAQNGTAYTLGGTLNFDVPIISGAYAESIRVYTTLNFTNTAGGTPALAMTAAGTYGLYNDVSVTFGNKQATLHPYFTKVLAQTRGYNRTPSGTVIGQSVAGIQNMLHSVPAIAAGANTWKTYFDIPLNAIHPTSPFGLLPIGGSGTRMQIQLATAQSLVGSDPLNFPMALGAGGTNVISAISGTVNVVVFYRDYKSMSTPQQLQANLTGLPTAQILKMRDLGPLMAGSMQYASIVNPYPFVKTVSLVIDGTSTAKFADAANIQAFTIDGAENTSSQLRAYNSTTGGMANYYSRHRQLYGNDCDEGVLVFDANAENSANSSLQEGEAWLNVTNNGYPAARLGFQVGTATAANGITPRIVTCGVIINPVGIS